MSQGFFESDDDYRERTSREADERTIEDSTGSAPSKGWFENDDNYRERISREADERTVEDSTGSAPSKGWFENDDDYRERISREADERTVEDSTGSAPSKGWFEGDHNYETRVRREANEHTIERDTGSAPKKGWFEGDHDYRSRIAHEAREIRARERPESTAESDSDSSSSYGGDSGYSSGGSSSSGTSTGSGGAVVALLILAVVAVAVLSKTTNGTSSTQTGQAVSVTGSSSNQPQTPTDIFANTTLLYTSHMSDWAIYFGRGESGQCQYFAQQFEARGGATARGTKSYSINSLGSAKWQISTQGTKPDDVSNIVFWINSLNPRAPDNQTVIEASGNIYDRNGKPMWPNGERDMKLTFRRGNTIPSTPAQEMPPVQLPRYDLGRADEDLNRVYQKLTAILPANKLQRLREAQRDWLKFRDTEAARIARQGGAVGGSAYYDMFCAPAAKLTRERTEVLRGYLANPNDIP